MNLSALTGIMLVAMLFFSSLAHAQGPSHAYINTQRSSSITHYYVSMGVDGEVGKFQSKNVAELADDEDGDGDDELSPSFRVAKWQGYGVKNELGLEFLKFLQFNVGHTSLNLRSKHDSTENLSGSRLNGGSSLNFYAPLGNLKMGGGILASRMDYRRQGVSGDFYGSGYYYQFGYNYFMSSKISFYMDFRQMNENLIHNSGGNLPKSIKTKMTSAGMGFKVWL